MPAHDSPPSRIAIFNESDPYIRALVDAFYREVGHELDEAPFRVVQTSPDEGSAPNRVDIFAEVRGRTFHGRAAYSPDFPPEVGGMVGVVFADELRALLAESSRDRD